MKDKEINEAIRNYLITYVNSDEFINIIELLICLREQGFKNLGIKKDWKIGFIDVK